MLHSQDTLPIAKSQQGKLYGLINRFFSAIACAQFTKSENIIVSYVLLAGWLRARILFSHCMAFPCDLDPEYFKETSGLEEREIIAALKSLETGHVLSRNSHGWWHLNPYWRDWTFEDGSARIHKQHHEFISWDYRAFGTDRINDMF